MADRGLQTLIGACAVKRGGRRLSNGARADSANLNDGAEAEEQRRSYYGDSLLYPQFSRSGTSLSLEAENCAPRLQVWLRIKQKGIY